MAKREFPEGEIPITIHVSEKLYNELKVGAEKAKKEIPKFIVDVLFDCDVADVE